MLQSRLEVAQVDGLVDHQQELRQGKLTFAQDAEGAGHGFAAVALAHHCGRQRVVTGLAIAPQVAHGRHHHREERRQHLLQEVSEIEVFLPRFAHDGGRPDRVLAMTNRLDTHPRIVMRLAVIAVVIAERALWAARTGRDLADDGELCRGNQGHRPGRVVTQRDLLAQHQARQQQLGHILRQRRNRTHDQGRRSSDIDLHRQGLPARFGLHQVEPAALADLHVHAKRIVGEDLSAIHAQVRAMRGRVTRVHQRQRDKAAAIARPSFQRGQLRQHRRRHHFGDGAARALLEADLGQGTEEITLCPQLAQSRRQQLFRQLGSARDDRLRPRAKGHLDALARAEQVGHERKARTFDLVEDEHRPISSDDTPVNLRHLQVAINLAVHIDNFSCGTQARQEVAQVLGSGSGGGDRLHGR